MTKAVKYLLFLVVIVIGGCKEDPPPEPSVPLGDIDINFHIQKDGNSIALEDVFAFDTINETTIKILKFYLSHINLKKVDGTMIKISDVAIIDFADTGLTKLSLHSEIADYKEIVLGVGLNETQNNSFPPDFALDHPLSSYYAMYWDWGMKYRFVILEGSSNENGSVGGAGDVHYAYHPGADAFYHVYNYPLNFSVSEVLTSININIDFDTIFRGAAGSVDIINENQSHTTPSDYTIAERIMLNFAEAISVELK